MKCSYAAFGEQNKTDNDSKCQQVYKSQKNSVTRGRNREARPTTANTKKSVNMSSKKRHPAFNRKHPATGRFYVKKLSCISAYYTEKYPIMISLLGKSFV